MHKKNVMLYPKKRPFMNEIHLENKQNACVIH